MTKPTILVADDEARIRRLVGDFLKVQGYNILEAKDGREALDVFNEHGSQISLIILDIMMPQLDGWQVLSEIRTTSMVPVLLLTAKGEERDQLNGFKLGADDFVTKPFSPSILTARVAALLKRTATPAETVLSAGGITVDNSARKVLIDEKEIQLTPKEYELLLYLMENENIALTREKILNSVWDYDYFGGLRTVDTHIKQLRAKLEHKGDCIKTVRSIGYRFEAQ